MTRLKNNGLFSAAILVALAALVGGAVVLAHEPGHAPVVEHHSDHAYLGVYLEEEIEHPEGGARVEQVVDDSPADEAGLQEGDVIVGFGGETIRGPKALTHRIGSREPGDTVELEIVRDGSRQTMTVELGKREVNIAWVGKAPELFEFQWDAEDLQEKMQELHERLQDMDFNVEIPNLEHFQFFGSSRPKLGVQLVEATPELRTHLGGDEDTGVLVGKVMHDMPAEKAGIRVGDLIVGVDGEDISSTADLLRALEDSSGKTIRVEIVRDGKLTSLDAVIPESDDDEETFAPRAFRLDLRELRGAHRAALAAARESQGQVRAAASEARRAYREAMTLSRRQQREAAAEARDGYRRAVREYRRVLRDSV